MSNIVEILLLMVGCFTTARNMEVGSGSGNMGTWHRWSKRGVADMQLRCDIHGWLMVVCVLGCRATQLEISEYTQRNATYL